MPSKNSDRFPSASFSFGVEGAALRMRLWGQQPRQSKASIRGIEADIGKEHADTFRNVKHSDLRADYVLANPPFNDSDTALRGSAFVATGGTIQVMPERHDNGSKDDDVRWQPSGARQIAKGNPQGERGGVHQFGVPPKGNANFARVQYFIHHLAPQTALRDSAILQSEAKPQVVSEAKDNMAALPGQLFYSTQIPVCLWFISRDKSGGKPSTRPAGHPSPAGRKAGDEGVPPKYEDVPGFCKSATTAEIAAHSHVLTPGRYVGAEDVEGDGEPFEEKMPRLGAELNAQFAESAKLEAAIRANLKSLNFTT